MCVWVLCEACVAVEWSAAAASLLTAVLVGKRKYGSASVSADTVICTLHTVDGQRFAIRATVRGRLLEVNEGLVRQQQRQAASVELLEGDSEWSGYVCVLLMDKPQLYDLSDHTDSRYTLHSTA